MGMEVVIGPFCKLFNKIKLHDAPARAYSGHLMAGGVNEKLDKIFISSSSPLLMQEMHK